MALIERLAFQSTLPRRERRSGQIISFPSLRFQSTLPRRERRKKYLRKAHVEDFNPRSHEGSDKIHNAVLKKYKISIHAPTKGATAILSNFTSYIFQFPLIFTNIFLLIFYLYHLPITFVHLFWCESSYTTVSTYHSHSNHIIRTSSAEIPLSTPTCSIFVLY